jgi:hypothetical protein
VFVALIAILVGKGNIVKAPIMMAEEINKEEH